MIKRSNISLLILILSLAFILFACSSSGSSEPTQGALPVEPTGEQAEPTAAPAEATEAPEEPTNMPEATEALAEETAEEPISGADETTPADEPESETPPPEDTIYVKTINGYRDDLGYLHIVGLVTNNTDRVVDDVAVEVAILDSDGNTLYAEITTITPFTLTPGETAPFSYWVSEELPEADRYSATVVSQSDAEIERATIKVDGVLLAVDDNGDIHLTGKIVNNSVKPILIDTLAAATFNENGKLLTADSHSVIVRYLDPGEDGPFRVTMTGPDSDSVDIAEYEIYVDAEVATPVEIFDFSTSESHYYYIDAYNFFHLVGEVTNNNNEFFTISLISGIYDVDGNVVDAATTDIPTFSIAPGETLPYDFQYWGPLNYQNGAIDTASNYFVQWDPYWTWSSSSENVELSTDNDNFELSANQVTFTGDVINDSGEEIQGATVIVTLYNKDSGELVAMGYGGIYDPIASYQTTPYQIMDRHTCGFRYGLSRLCYCCQR